VSGKASGWFLRLGDKPDDPDLFKVLVVMADAADERGANIKVASETVGFRANLTRATARRRIEEALADPRRPWALEVVDPGNRRRTTVYRFPNFQARPDSPGERLLAVLSAIVANNSPNGTSGALPDSPEELLATLRTALANTEKLLAIGGQYVGQTATQIGQQMATPRTSLATNVFTKDVYAPAPPATAQGGRAGAEEAQPVAGEPVGAKQALIRLCAKCDEHGLITDTDGAAQPCDHRPGPGKPISERWS